MVAGSATVSMGGRRVASLLGGTARSLSGRQPLYNTVASEHAPVDREVAAHHKRPHRGILLR